VQANCDTEEVDMTAASVYIHTMSQRALATSQGGTSETRVKHALEEW